jgi:hypothetical protein
MNNQINVVYVGKGTVNNLLIIKKLTYHNYHN